MLNKPFVITGGHAYTDIDVLACAMAYQQLLGQQAHAVLIGPWNQTIPATISSWPLTFEKTLPSD